MEYKQKYIDALECARECLQDSTISATAQAYILGIFPELRESHDERIRNAICGWIYTQPAEFFDSDISKEEMLEWVKNHDEQSVEPKWCHHKVDLSDCSEKYRKAYYDGWNNCNVQYAQCKAESNKKDDEIRKELIEQIAYIIPNNDEVDDVGNTLPIYKERIDKYRAWLEEQGNIEYIDKAPYEIAEKEKDNFVSGRFIDCIKSFNNFKEGNSYWLEYIGNDTYVGRSDDILNEKFHITPGQLYCSFTQQCPKENDMPIAYGKYVDECLNEASQHFLSEGEDKYSIADLFYAGIRCERSWHEKQGQVKENNKFLTNEDDRIKKTLKGFVTGYSAFINGQWMFGDFNVNRVIDWLDRQGESSNTFKVPEISIKDAEEVTSRMQYISDDMKPIADFIMGYANWDLHKDEWNRPTLTVPLFRVLDALVQRGKPYCERVQNTKKQCEQKPDNNDEPKFKKKDWIVANTDVGLHFPLQIIDVDKNQYQIEDGFGNSVSPYINYIDRNYHLWTAADAKDGDILVMAKDCSPFIFKGFLDTFHPDCPVAYCGLDEDNEFTISSGIGWWDDGEIQPATKEQRDLLFEKMRDAGYEWDPEKKELRHDGDINIIIG